MNIVAPYSMSEGGGNGFFWNVGSVVMYLFINSLQCLCLKEFMFSMLIVVACLCYPACKPDYVTWCKIYSLWLKMKIIEI
jgi:hypothetical protein